MIATKIKIKDVEKIICNFIKNKFIFVIIFQVKDVFNNFITPNIVIEKSEIKILIKLLKLLY